jgi:hypothetical protein
LSPYRGQLGTGRNVPSKRAPLSSASGEARRLPWVPSASAYLPMGFSKWPPNWKRITESRLGPRAADDADPP